MNVEAFKHNKRLHWTLAEFRVQNMLKFIGIFSGLVIFSVLAFLMYFGRNQTIDFSSQLPSKFELCGKEINDQNVQYLALNNWLKTNTSGWQYTPVSYLIFYFYQTQYKLTPWSQV